MVSKHCIAIIAGQLVVGGAERQLYLWLSHLDREKFQPVVLTLHPGHGDYWEGPIESLGIPLLQIPHHRVKLVRAMDIVKRLSPYKPQLIHGWHIFSSPYAGISARILGARSLGGVRGNIQSFYKARPEADLSLWLVDAILANSSSAAKQLSIHRKRCSQRIYTVRNAVEMQPDGRSEARYAISQRFSLPPSNIWLGSVGRMDYGKRFDLLLQALKLLCQEVKNFRFLLIGDGPERSNLERLSRELEIDQYIIFTGELPNASRLLSALDIFCFTSLDEGLPNVIMEAAAAGLPIVTWRVDFAEELLKDGEVALLVEPENTIHFKQAVNELMRSPELRIHYGRVAREHVLTTFSVDRFVQNMTAVYEKLLDTHRS